MTFKKGQSGNPNGKPIGTANKSTTQVRNMIAQMADNLVPEVQGWLVKTANGERDPNDHTKWIVKPDPGYASSLYFQMIEYHIPKLARVESHVTAGAEKSHEEWLDGLE